MKTIGFTFCAMLLLINIVFAEDIASYYYGELPNSYQNRANQGDVEAAKKLAVAYFEGTNGLKKDFSEAMKWAAMVFKANGNPEYAKIIGYIYHDGGYGVQKNHKKAIEWYKLAYNAGEKISSPFNIGLIYRNGSNDVLADYKEAVKWYRISAANGGDEAPLNLGYMYFNGIGVKKDYKEAFKWYSLAVSKSSNAGAMCTLAELYASGKGTPKNIAKSKQLAQQGFEIGGAGSGYCKDVWERFELANY